MSTRNPETTGLVQVEEVTRGDIQTRFKPGQSGNPKGRPKGSRHKLGEQFVAALQADFEEHGAQAIEMVRIERPHHYLRVIAAIIPKDINSDASDPIAELLQSLNETVFPKTVQHGSNR